MRIPRSARSGMYPKFISDKAELLDSSAKQKIFPKIGLKNSVEPLSIVNDEWMNKQLHNYLQSISMFVRKCLTDHEIFRESNICAHAIGLHRICSIIDKSPQDCIKWQDGKFNLVMPENYPPDVSILEVITEMAHRAMEDGFNEFGTLKSINQYDSIRDLQNPNFRLRVCFSSTGNKGLWDIATMSMRGIQSCQHWGGRYKDCIIGSMADPYLGVIYIDDNTDHYNSDTNKYMGSRMIRRALVRYVLNKNTKKPTLLVERIYPHNYNSEVPDYTTSSIFHRFLAQKTRNRYDFQYGQAKGVSKYRIPYSSVIKQIRKKELSYRDSGIPYRLFDDYLDPSSLSARKLQAQCSK